MKGRDFLYSTVGLAALTLQTGAFGSFSLASDTGKRARRKIIGMYIHQHWPNNHPYAARTWSVDDYRGFADGLKKIGYNMIMIWPVLETMPQPLTPSDRANLDKLGKVSDVLHHEFEMQAYIILCPNVGAKNEEAAMAFPSRGSPHHRLRKMETQTTRLIAAMKTTIETS